MRRPNHEGFPAPTVRPDTSSDSADVGSSTHRTFPAPTERLDTSIARQGYDHPHRTFSGLKDRWIYARMTVFKLHPSVFQT